MFIEDALSKNSSSVGAACENRGYGNIHFIQMICKHIAPKGACGALW
jgi:hypothetical protein